MFKLTRKTGATLTVITGFILGLISLGEAVSAGFGQQSDEAWLYSLIHLVSTVMMLVGLYFIGMDHVTGNTQEPQHKLRTYRALLFILMVIIFGFDIWLVVALFL